MNYRFSVLAVNIVVLELSIINAEIIYKT